MAFVSVIEAAVLVGKSTPTIYRHIKGGKLSRTSSGKIDTAELLRIYGAFKSTRENQNDSKSTEMLLIESSAIESCNAHIATLKAQVDEMANELKQSKIDLKEIRAEGLARENRLMALLEHKSEQGAGSLFGKLFK